jgi:hypothetical protein
LLSDIERRDAILTANVLLARRVQQAAIVGPAPMTAAVEGCKKPPELSVHNRRVGRTSRTGGEFDHRGGKPQEGIVIRDGDVNGN